MKKRIYTCLSTLLIATLIFAQSTTEKPDVKIALNEVRLNLASTVLGLPELNYERFTTGNTGVGIAFSYSTNKLDNLMIRSIVLPYYRVYFGAKKGAGFFMEANIGVVTQNNIYNDRQYTYALDETLGYSVVTGYVDKTYSTWKTTVTPGAAIGLKILSKNGICGEMYIGGGRTYLTGYDKFYPRMGVSIGKRF